MKNQHRVVWTKGMFLTPQHFQTQDQYLNDTIQFRFAASHFANYGVIDLEIDREGLQNGVFRLTRCRGIMPDGESFDMPDVDALPTGRDIQDHFPETAPSLDVYLALPERRLQQLNVTMNDSGTNGTTASTRFSAYTREITDEHATSDPRPIDVAVRNYRILFGTENRDGFTKFRIAQIVRNTAGAPVVNETFVAPCLNLAHSEYLMRLLRREIEILANRCNTLSAERRQKGKVQADFGPTETFNFWLLHTVNSFLPEIRHFYKVRHGHPEAAWLSMLRLAGALSTFSLETTAATLPDYDHNNLGGCFSALDERIRNLIDVVAGQNYRSIPLSLTDRFIWSGNIPDDGLFRNSQFYLAVSAKMGVDDIIRKVPQYVKVANNDEMDRLIRSALSGLTLRHTPVPPSAIRVKVDQQYFSLNQEGRLWEGIQLSRSIAVFAPSDIVDPKLEVIVVFD